MFDLTLAQSHMTLPNEGIPHGNDRFDWAYKPNVDLGYKSDSKTPNLITWYTIHREAGSKPTVNSRVEIKNLTLWLKGASGWTMAQQIANPDNDEYPEPPNQWVGYPANKRIESDGFMSVRPTEYHINHGYGKVITPNLADLQGLCVTMDFRVITDDLIKPDTRLTDKFVVNVGADWWTPQSVTNGYAIDAFNGRFLKALPEWRTAYAIA